MASYPSEEFDPKRARATAKRILETANCEECAADAIDALISSMAKHGHRRSDPVRSLMSNLGDRWSTLILILLGVSRFRYAALHKLINAVRPPDEHKISQRMLTLRLRVLEREGLVHRTVIDTVPPQVEYRLTTFGAEFLVQINAIITWINSHETMAMSARLQADSRTD